MRKTKFSSLYVYLWMLIVIGACQSCDKEHVPVLPGEIDLSDDYDGTPSDVLRVRIYFDATGSMKGFVVPGQTQYTRIIPILESAVLTGWADGKAEFFRFGKWVETIDRTSYLRMQYPESYIDDISRQTFIQKVIDYETQETDETQENQEPSDNAKADRLVVIVTDLFQAENDINLLVAPLKDRYLRNNNAVGLLGIRSQFDGFVYDSRSHKSNIEDPESFRPFYVLALGKHADVARYFDTLIAAGLFDAKIVILSRHLTKSLASFERALIGKTEHLVQDEIIPQTTARLKQFLIRGNPDRAMFSATLKYSPLPHVMLFDSNTIEASVVARHCPTGQTEVSPEARNCLDMKAALTTDGLNVTANLSPKSLPGKGIYLYEVSLYPKLSGYGIPAWCSSGKDGWDMGLEFNGSRTLNLGNLVRSLSQAAAQIYQPKIGELYFYLQKR